MSYDQKPAKMRVVRGAGTAAAPTSPQRRRGDQPAAAPTPAAPATATAGQASSFPIGLVLMLFIAGCAVGGAALPLLGIV